MANINELLEYLKRTSPGQDEFHQAAEEYKTLLECQIRLNQVIGYITHEDYASTREIEKFCGIAYRAQEENEND